MLQNTACFSHYHEACEEKLWQNSNLSFQGDVEPLIYWIITTENRNQFE